MATGSGRVQDKTVFATFIKRFPPFFGTLLAVYSFIALLFSAVRPFRHQLQSIREFFDYVILPMPEVSISWALALGLLAGAILARKRLAWWVSVILLVILNIENILLFVLGVNGYDTGSTITTVELNVGFIVQAVMLIGLLVTRSAFPARTRHAAIRKAFAVYVIGEGLVTASGWLLVELFPHTLSRGNRLQWVLNKSFAFSLVDQKFFGGHPEWIVSFALTLARAVLEATAYQTREVLDAMVTDSGVDINALKVDGGMVMNEFLMQFQSDIINTEVVRPKNIETTALGAAYAAGLSAGFWDSLNELKEQSTVDKVWKPKMGEDERKQLYSDWNRAVERTYNWEESTNEPS